MVNITDLKAIRGLVSEVCDPEIPALSIADLGILREIYFECEGSVETLVVEITPTYVGCPAMDTISDDIRSILAREGIDNVRIKTRLAPAWTTDWMSDAGREKLLAAGIAPPQGRSCAMSGKRATVDKLSCPQCGSTNTECVSEFGSTACKALYRCRDCLEPFDYFKCI